MMRSCFFLPQNLFLPHFLFCYILSYRTYWFSVGLLNGISGSLYVSIRLHLAFISSSTFDVWWGHKMTRCAVLQNLQRIFSEYVVTIRGSGWKGQNMTWSCISKGLKTVEEFIKNKTCFYNRTQNDYKALHCTVLGSNNEWFYEQFLKTHSELLWRVIWSESLSQRLSETFMKFCETKIIFVTGHKVTDFDIQI